MPYARAEEKSSSMVRKGKIRAAMLYYITRFIKWPEASVKNGLGVCIVGSDPLNDYIEETFAGKSFNGVDAQIFFVKDKAESLQEKCDLFYFGKAEEIQYDELALDSAFTVAGQDLPSSVKAMIELYEDSNKLRLRVNYDLVQGKGYNVSSELLAIAEVRR